MRRSSYGLHVRTRELQQVPPQAVAAPPTRAAVHWEWALVVPALALIVVGVWLTRGRRDDIEEQRRIRRLQALAGKEGPGGVLAGFQAWKLTLREPTRMVVGASSILMGYHIGAWVMPARWQPLSVPLERWWIVVLIVVLAVGGSLLMDRWQARTEPR